MALASVGETIASRNNNYNMVRLLLSASVIYWHSFGLTRASPYVDYITNFVLPSGLPAGVLAVDCFFFLSGLFVTQSFYRDPSLVNFVVRRFCRIWPGLFLCVLLTASIACILSERLEAWRYLFEPAFYHYVLNNAALSLVMTIPGVFQNLPYNGINGPLHTLPMEASMYVVLLCLGAALLLRRRWTIFAAGSVIFLVIVFDYGFLVRHFSLSDFWLPPMAMFFAGVMLFAVASHVTVRWWVGAICLGAAIAAPAAWKIVLTLATAIIAMLLAGQMKSPWRPRADISYGLYIYGWPCQQFIVTGFPHINPYVLALSALLLAGGFASLSWRLVERPALAFGQSVTSAWSALSSHWPPALDLARMPPLAAAPRAATIGVVFLIFLGGSWVSAAINITPVSPLGTKIIAFGPTETRAGHGFNVQPSGDSAIWITLDQRPPDGTVIVLDGARLDTVVGEKSASAVVPPSLFAHAGEKAVFLELHMPNLRQRSNSVTLRVTN